MDEKKYEAIIKDIDTKRHSLHKKKARDYATVDVLSNFKRLSRAANNLGIDVSTPWGYALFMTLMKLDRINNIMHKLGKHSNEGIEDSIIDAHNYLDLSLACFTEWVEDNSLVMEESG